MQPSGYAMSSSSRYGRERTSDAPLSIDVAAAPERSERRLRSASAWSGLSGYVAAGVSVGMLLVVAFSMRDDAVAARPGPDAVTDTVVRISANELAPACWDGHAKGGSARLTVALEVGVDGKVRYATVAGETAALRKCIESRVRDWEFLPQGQALTMALPFEIQPP